MLRKKLREKITKLSSVIPGKDFILLNTATLTLRVPSNILHSNKSASDVIKAFDNAVKAHCRV
jgi:ribosome-associated translation inhibitor RaiA